MSTTTFSCASCCRPIADSLARLGSVRCHDCLDTDAPVREACVAALPERRMPRELDQRQGDGIIVTLLWYEETNQIAVRVLDERRLEEFELGVAAHDARDAFLHPYAYLLADAA